MEQFARPCTASNAVVDNVASETYDGDVMLLKDYAALNTSHQLNKGVDLLLSMDGKMDRTIDELKGLREEIQPGLGMQLRQMQADIRAPKERMGML